MTVCYRVFDHPVLYFRILLNAEGLFNVACLDLVIKIIDVTLILVFSEVERS